MKNIITLERDKYYHIYNRGINGETLFKEQENYSYFLKLYQFHINEISETLAWCLMGNHFHFFVRLKNEDEILSNNNIAPHQSFSNLFNAYTKAFNKKFGRHGALFERPFRRKIVENEEYMRKLICYIHKNPVNHGFCDSLQDYKWSSYNTCLSNKTTKLSREKVIEIFGDFDNFKFVHENYDTIEEFY